MNGIIQISHPLLSCHVDETQLIFLITLAEAPFFNVFILQAIEEGVKL